jgi:hypothetical protein
MGYDHIKEQCLLFLNRQANAFPVACGGVSERITKGPIPYGRDSLKLVAESFNRPIFLIFLDITD